ncbi:hypothetical protein [Wolbachia endosymbiont of Wuchereria bancrofti]|uniref:hypothetical protein n=1 Tax=Wolbachia endosymbiont of Wuchereria bancrofti TaxID=96496 RepID=UPI00034DA7AA|nr:hypothetical protein [Wolbachia endosymbiont of Wuchereria bancrofti]
MFQGNVHSNTNCYVIITKVRVNSKTTLSFPTASYVIIGELTDQRFIMIDYSRRVHKVLNNFSQGPQLKLKTIENNNKLALVTSSDEPYYYYYNESVTV